MVEPRWHTTQRIVEHALMGGPKTVKEIVQQTGLSTTTVHTCLDRAHTTASLEWPRRYILVKSMFDSGEDEESIQTGNPIVHLVHIVKPLEIPVEEVGPRWQGAREKIGQEVAEIDLRTLNLETALKHLELEAASLLGMIVALRTVKNGPDWRDQIGLAP